MAFDECTPYPASYDVAKDSMDLSMRWAVRSLKHFKQLQQEDPTDAALFGIIQGGMYNDLRQQSLNFLAELDFPGYAIGGLSVGEPKEEMQRILENFADKMPKEKPRYLMGVGTPLDLAYGVSQGIDMFDCVMPTRNARNGYLFTSLGVVRIKNNQYKLDNTYIKVDRDKNKPPTIEWYNYFENEPPKEWFDYFKTKGKSVIK
jgi:queuine tRNA-ribosyltransferase